MATKDNTPENQNSIDVLNERLTDMSTKVEDNKKIITIVVVVLVAIILGILGYIYLVRNPKAARAAEAIGTPDVQLALGNDSVALMGYQDVADSYGSTVGARADVMAAGILYENGDYEQAIAALDDFDAPEELTAAAALALKGDSYANAGNLAEAAKCYEKAIKESDNNPYYTPYFILKLARIDHAMGDYQAEADAYEKVKAQYPSYAASAQIDVDKYIARAKALAAQK
ncbi:MAG: tetratricopeptide repeat protein [Bacteroidales bacterium]|nr:tetratricopeptide repeat protein [Bacteroidales bacterium]